MKSNKGFTLIEVLTVIVVLAIIALIAVPVIMGLVGKAQKSAFKDSAYALIKAGDLLYSTNEMEGAVLERKTFTFPDNAKALKVKGELPTGGIMKVYENGEIAMAVTSGKYCATKKYGSKEVVVTEDAENCELKVFEIGDVVYFDPTLGENGMLCTKVEYSEENSKVGVNSGCMKWHVYASEGENYNLILDHNVTKRFNLNVKDNTNFITELMSQLKKDTSTWKVDADVIELDTLLNLIPYYQNLSEEEKDNWVEGYDEKLSEVANYIINSLKESDVDNGCDTFRVLYESEIEIASKLEEESPLLPYYFYNEFGTCEWDEENNNFLSMPNSLLEASYWVKNIEGNTNAWANVYEINHVLAPAPVDLTASEGQQYRNVGIRPVITITQ